MDRLRAETREDARRQQDQRIIDRHQRPSDHPTFSYSVYLEAG